MNKHPPPNGLISKQAPPRPLFAPCKQKMLSPLFRKGVAFATHSNTADTHRQQQIFIGEVVYWPFPA